MKDYNKSTKAGPISIGSFDWPELQKRLRQMRPGKIRGDIRWEYVGIVQRIDTFSEKIFRGRVKGEAK